MIGETGDFGIAIALIVLSLIVWFASYKYSMRVMKRKSFNNYKDSDIKAF